MPIRVTNVIDKDKENVRKRLAVIQETERLAAHRKPGREKSRRTISSPKFTQ